MKSLPTIVRPYFTTKIALIIASIGSALLFGIWSVTPKQAHFLTDENGIVENVTMAFFAIASILSLYYAFQAKGAIRYYLFLWALLSFVFCGEEISWGQHWLGFETPEMLSSNVQSEANLHNLPWLTPKVVKNPNDIISSQGAFYAGFTTYFLLLPLFALWRPTASILKRFRFPAPNTPLLIAIWIPVGFSFLLAIVTQTRAIRDALTETRELYFAVSILLYVIFLVTLAIPKSSPSESAAT